MAHELREKAKVEAQVKSAASNALVVSIIGLVICCIPVIAIVALVMGVRARGLARQHGVIPPGGAAAAIAISVVSLIAFAAGLTFSIVEDQRKQERITKLEKRIEDDVDDKKLDLDTACALVEIHVLEEGYGGTSATSIEGVDCPGKLRNQGETASLDDIQIKSTKTETAVACFKRGSKWYVERLGKESCDDSAESGASAESPTPAPSVKP
jgi:hypothetical protein